MAVEAVPGVLDGVSTGAVVQRHTTTALAAGREGVCGADHLEVTQSSTPGMTVRVAAGYALVAGSTTTHQGLYSFHNDAAVDDLAIAAGDPSNDRHDIVVAQVRDSTYAGSDDDARLFVVQGTPAGSPSDPPLPASCIALARIVVSANESTSIVNADITDLREFAGDWGVSWGRVASVTSSTTQSGVTSVTDITGMSVTAPLVAGRRYRVYAEATFQQLSSAGLVDFQLTTSGNSIYRQRRATLDASFVGTIPLTYEHVATVTGNVSFKLRAGTSGGTVTIRPTGVTEMGHVLIVEDIGPA